MAVGRVELDRVVALAWYIDGSGGSDKIVGSVPSWVVVVMLRMWDGSRRWLGLQAGVVQAGRDGETGLECVVLDNMWGVIGFGLGGVMGGSM